VRQMEKIYGPFYLEEHKYYIKINRDSSSPLIQVFEHYEGKGVYYRFKALPHEVRKNIEFFDEHGGEEFLTNFLAEKNHDLF
jgi:hypothetical protein